MIQDIPESVSLFPEVAPTPGDWVLLCKGAQADLAPWSPVASVAAPLVRVGERAFFLGSAPGMAPGSPQRLRALPEAGTRFGAFCALHLARWLLAHRYCGRCGAPMVRVGNCLRCVECAQELYPTIAPAVILGLTHQGRLLVTRYADRPYKGPALVAGYCEVGETAEETCRREALEETGLRVTRLRYFASQPWGLSGSLLLGFFGEVEDPRVTLADGELSEATWMAPSELPPPPDAAGPLSLTATMIEAWRGGGIEGWRDGARQSRAGGRYSGGEGDEPRAT